MEIWKSIPCLKNCEASSLGRIRTTWFYAESSINKGLPPKVKIIKTHANENGYLTVKLHELKRKRRVHYLVHRLVAFAFLGEPSSSKLVVNHINHVRTDNRLENLEWITYRENNRHSKRRSGFTQKEYKLIHPTQTDLLFIKRLLKKGADRCHLLAIFTKIENLIEANCE